MTIGLWIIPALLTVVTLGWPIDKGSDQFGFGSAIVGLVKMLAISLLWLLYFIVMAVAT
jgi:hypothetical protein